MKKVMTASEFNRFLVDTRLMIENDSSLDYFIYDNKTVVFNIYTNKCGVARCHDEDFFCTGYGLVLAYCRMNNIDFPKVKREKTVTLNDLNYGDAFKYLRFNYIFLAKHPTNNNHCYAINETTTDVEEFCIEEECIIEIEE